MSKKKILVCGSAGFLMSNFMRYLLYRSRDYEIVSVDMLKIPKDYKRVYLNKNHRFYIGDITDKYFMDRLITIEKPDWIVNGVGSFSYRGGNAKGEHAKTIINGVMLLEKYGIPTIQLAQDFNDDLLGFNRAAAHVLLGFRKTNPKNNTILFLPNCFGLRQKPTAGLGQMMYVVNKPIINIIYVTDDLLPWVYAEDVASLIWYIIEQKVYGEVKMPPLGKMSLRSMANMVCNTLDIKPEIREVKSEKLSVFDTGFWEPICFWPKEGSDNIKGWMPDSESLEASIEKTARWYKANQWIFNN